MKLLHLVTVLLTLPLATACTDAGSGDGSGDTTEGVGPDAFLVVDAGQCDPYDGPIAICQGGDSAWSTGDWSFTVDAPTTAEVQLVEATATGFELHLIHVGGPDGVAHVIPLAAAPELTAGDEVDIETQAFGTTISLDGHQKVVLVDFSIDSFADAHDVFRATADGDEVEVMLGDVPATLAGACAGDAPHGDLCPAVGVLQHSLTIGGVSVGRGGSAQATLADGRSVAILHEGLVSRDDRFSSETCGLGCADFWFPKAAVSLTITTSDVALGD